MRVNRLQLQSSASTSPGDLGFKLIGESVEQPGKLARVWVRRKRGGGRNVWHRYLEPVAKSEHWEVRLCVTRPTGALTAVPFSVAALDALAADYVFAVDGEVRSLLASVDVDDVLFRAVRDWALAVTLV